MRYGLGLPLRNLRLVGSLERRQHRRARHRGASQHGAARGLRRRVRGWRGRRGGPTGGSTGSGAASSAGTSGGQDAGCADAPIPDSGYLPTSRLSDGGFYSYNCVLNGTPVSLYYTRQRSVETFPDAINLGPNCVNFQTQDPTYSCLNGENINVYTAHAEYPCMYAIHNGGMGAQCTYATWLYPQ